MLNNYLGIASLVIFTATLSGLAGYFFHKKIVKLSLRRVALRNENGGLKIAFVPQDDGSMELLLSAKAIKALKRNEDVTGEIKGAKSSMIFRVRLA